ncbi:aminoglycoside 6-adenylyltransferase [Hazenella sp. IB182353]|uniref:aminoglycoside 6-adenylyltransferase n=1 Tax=Polycladospora coralii TaxID=2771432 RepID=UPI0017465AFF|nr:aminoglycoside 6-adenylyltransferase [Polycladospora coralii]MBS7531037.1 aminoglycoside 6-adenylyltransferase [Polycladospora coralii]
MRTEDEMFELIIHTAEKDERIRAVILSGSRTNPHVKKDRFQDFDIIYLVNHIDSFIVDENWIDIFGERMIMQLPEAKVIPPPMRDGRFTYLMQFTDGNRIDLTLMPISLKEKLLPTDSLSQLLLDKDGILESLPPPSDHDYWVRKPSEQAFLDICNEFWWICLNISKGLCRNEFTYTMYMYEQINRHVLNQMMEWYIGIQNHFSVSVGNLGKHMPNYLTNEEWELYLSTYTDAKVDHIWRSLFNMCQLFRQTASHVARYFNYTYPDTADKNVTFYLHKLKKESSS